METKNFSNQKPTLLDRLMDKIFLRFFPKNVAPNHLTILRFFCIPFVAIFLLINHFGIGIFIFIIAALTDAFDGAMARVRNQITDWGALYDPLADKLLISTTAIIMIPKYLSAWIAFAIIFIEMILIGASYYSKNHGGKVIQSNLWGKLKMICQSFGIGFLMLYALIGAPIALNIALFVFCAAIFLALISLVTYSI